MVQNPAPPKKPWIDDSPINANKLPFHSFKVDQDFVHPQYVHGGVHPNLSPGLNVVLAPKVNTYP